MRERLQERGLSAIEALVALALLAIVFVPLMDLQMSVARQAAQQTAVRERLTAQHNALAMLRDTNPMATPQGERELAPGVTMRWTATPLSRESRSRAYPAGDGAFVVCLYSIDVNLSIREQSTSFSVEQIGWRRLAPGEDAAGRQRPRL